MQIHLLKPRTKTKNRKRIGRGGTRGKTSGRGHKGQKQHGGHGIRPQMRDEIKRIPKLRGRGVNMNTSVNDKAVTLNISVIEKSFSKGKIVSPKSLFKAGLFLKRGNSYPQIKILGGGEVSKKFTITGCKVSATAKEKIEKAGGKVK